jgi:hypothetical protein
VGEVTTLEGPVKRVEGRLVLWIPLVLGGSQLVECSRGIGEVDGEYLKVVVPDWLAEKMGITEGCRIRVDNRDGRFNIWRVDSAKPDESCSV